MLTCTKMSINNIRNKMSNKICKKGKDDGAQKKQTNGGLTQNKDRWLVNQIDIKDN